MFVVGLLHFASSDKIKCKLNDVLEGVENTP